LHPAEPFVAGHVDVLVLVQALPEHKFARYMRSNFSNPLRNTDPLYQTYLPATRIQSLAMNARKAQET
jgi:hypothetical protein